MGTNLFRRTSSKWPKEDNVSNGLGGGCITFTGDCPDCDGEDEPFFCEEMVELVKSIRNRCDFLLATCEDETLKPETLIEDLYEDCQALVDFCALPDTRIEH